MRVLITKQPARGQRRRPRPRRATPETQRRHPRAHANRFDGVSGRRPSPGRRIKRRVQRSRPSQEVTDEQLRSRAGPSPPVAHRLTRNPDPLPSPPVPLAADREQRRADHLHDIAPPGQAQDPAATHASPGTTAPGNDRDAAATVAPPNRSEPHATASSPNLPTRPPGNAGRPSGRQRDPPRPQHDRLRR